MTTTTQSEHLLHHPHLHDHQPFHPPPPNRETFKDLLIFEERLKHNAERLQRQRIKYEAFLVTIISVSIILAYKSFIAVSPYKLIHYLYVGLLLVSITTIILFFATGMYTDQIAYAYKFIPQTNRALRPFNMFLITPATLKESKGTIVGPQRKSLPSRIWNKLFSTTKSSSSAGKTSKDVHRHLIRPMSPPSSSPPSLLTISHPPNRPSSPPRTSLSDENKPELEKKTRSVSDIHPHPSGLHRETPQQDLNEIVHHLNPRGQLIFSSLVDPNFIHSYQVYRNQWELRQKKF